MRTPGQGLLAMGSPPSIQQRVHVKTGAFASNVFQSCVSCRLIIRSPLSRGLRNCWSGRRGGALTFLRSAVRSHGRRMHHFGSGSGE